MVNMILVDGKFLIIQQRLENLVLLRNLIGILRIYEKQLMLEAMKRFENVVILISHGLEERRMFLIVVFGRL